MSDLNQPGRPDEGGGGDAPDSEERLREEVGLEQSEASVDGSSAGDVVPGAPD